MVGHSGDATIFERGLDTKSLVRVMTSHLGNVTEIREVQCGRAFFGIQGLVAFIQAKKRKNRGVSSPVVSGGSGGAAACTKKVGYFPDSHQFSA